MPVQRGYLLPSERQILLRRYAPVLVLFPEIEYVAPYPDEGDAIYTMRGSYHPRAVELFLKSAKVRYKRYLALLRPGLLFNPRPIAQELGDIESAVTESDADRILNDPEREYENDPRYAGLDDAERRAVVRKRLIQQRLAQRIRGFDLPLSRGHNIRQWKRYFRLLADSEPETRRSVVYGRVVQGRQPLEGDLAAPESPLVGPDLGPYDVRRTRVALQYWFHYYYDDWANRHEGDWESITILLELSRDVMGQDRELDESALLKGITVQDVGYSFHEDGYRRAWQDVQRTRDDRPIVYVARGSSASYFAWQLEGYPASARVGFVEKALLVPGRLVRGQRLLGRRWDALYAARFTGRDPKNTDWVAADSEPEDRFSDESGDPHEKLVPRGCRGVRRAPDFGPESGCDDTTYHLETEDLFWLEMVQEYGTQWGEDSLLPGTKGPAGLNRAQLDKDRATIRQMAKLELVVEHALKVLSGIRFVSTEAIPELNAAMRPLRPKNLKKEDCFPRRICSNVYDMWARVLADHPEAWPGGPGLYLSLVFRRILYPSILGFFRKKPKPEPLLKRDDPIYHLKTLLAQARRVRYELQQEGSKWDNPFAWVRYVCLADSFFYGRTQGSLLSKADLLSRLDCVDVEMTME